VYNELYQAWKTEKENSELQPLPKDFYERLAEYTRKLREEKRMLDTKTVKAKLLKNETENVKKLVTELLQLRINKIAKALASGKSIPKNCLTKEEEKIGENVGELSDYFHNLTESVLQGKLKPTKKKTKLNKMVIRFLKDVPAIVGVDLKTYGPFKVEDVASLPIENAKLLIKQGIAVKIETD